MAQLLNYINTNIMGVIEIDSKTAKITERGYTEEELLQAERINSILQEIPYEQKVVDLIREKYTIDEELAIHRQKETKPNEFEIYFNYCEECKLKAKE